MCSTCTPPYHEVSFAQEEEIQRVQPARRRRAPLEELLRRVERRRGVGVQVDI